MACWAANLGIAVGEGIGRLRDGPKDPFSGQKVAHLSTAWPRFAIKTIVCWRPESKAPNAHRVVCAGLCGISDLRRNKGAALVTVQAKAPALKAAGYTASGVGPGHNAR